MAIGSTTARREKGLFTTHHSNWENMTASSPPHKFRDGLLRGLRKGLQSFLWMIKILVPVSFFTALLEWSGWLNHIDFLIQPLMGWLGLPAKAALPLVIGMLTNIYGGIAAMVMLPFTKEQMTLIAIFLLISHNLIQEGIIQGKSGIHPLKATLFRIVAACITVILVGQFLHTGAANPLAESVLTPSAQPFLTMLQNWIVATVRLAIKIFLIIISILTVVEILNSYGWIDRAVTLLAPFLRTLGLSDKVGILWLAGAFFGLVYGAALIVEEAKRGDLSKEELEGLHLSIGINHAVIEDPALFLSLGLSAFWLWVPRLVMAILAVRLLSLWHLSRRHRS